MSHKYTNDLINESSPYLLQHAHNPVNWVSWNEKTLKEAQKKNQLIIVSIGYSACHWCHVMEHESFEDEDVADLMNAHFTNIKIDREERPDIDQIYMSAVQLMTNSGGWPLNCICLPDGRPIYGGTYFPKDQWINILKNLVHLYQDDRPKMLDYATKLEEGIQNFELIEKSDLSEIQKSDVEEMVLRWSKNFDQREGGPNRAPKFPLPNNYEFLMNYAFLSGNESIKNHVVLTLNKMALGGIYDQIGGGFSRYSVDVLWKVPHFEKMLYDNAQLIHLYALAYQWTKHPLYKEVVYQTIDWLEREMRDPSGAFYSALDADSEGKEGKFYIWDKNELKDLLDPKDYEWLTTYYAIDDLGKWEDHYILLRPQTDEIFAKKNNITIEEVSNKRNRINTILFEAREKRVRPGLDDKSLTSWNAMATKGLLTAYKVFKEEEFLMLAKANYRWWEENQWQNEGGLWRNYKNKHSNIHGFLDDYACSIEMLLSFYTIHFDEKYLKKAKHLCMYAIQHFWDEERQMFYYTHIDQKDLLTRKMEVNDNVIPASNSIMANNLYQLSLYFANPEWNKMALQMLNNVSEHMSSYVSGYSNWGILALKKVFPSFELVMMGYDYQKYLDDCHQEYLPHIILAGGEKETIPLTENRASALTQFYLCENGACQLPEKNWGKIFKEINLSHKN